MRACRVEPKRLGSVPAYRRASARKSPMLYARYASLSLLLLTVLLTVVPAPGQTRRRPPPPVASPKSAPIRGLAEQAQRGELTFARFSNGLRLICGERHGSELAAVTVQLGFGEADEPPAAPGAAWAVAHGLLTEAERAELATAGATLDIGVGAQATTLTATAPATRMADIAKLLLRAVARAGFGEDQLRAGAAQAGRAWDACQSRAEAISRAAWLALAAGRKRASPLSGESFKAVTLEAAGAFHAANLTPRKTVVAVTGDISLVAALRAIADATANWNPKPAAVTPAPPAGERYHAEQGAQGRTRVQLGYALPALRDEERVALDIVCAALALGRRARLTEALVENRQLASEVAARLEATAQSATLRISLNVHPERLDRAEVLTLEAIERLRRERLSEGELQRAKAQLELERALESDDASDWSRQLAQVESSVGLLTWLDDADRLDSIDSEQVRAVAAKHLTASRLVVYEYAAATAPPRTFTPEKFFETVGLLVPQTLVADIPPGEATDAPETVVVSAKPRPKAKDGGLVALPPAEPVREYATLRGPRALVRPDPARPLVAIGFYFQGGRFVEDEITAGVTELMLRVMTRSSAKYAPDGLLDEIERFGGRLQIVNERDFFGFELCVVAPQAEAALRRLVTLVERPSFDAAAVKAERERLLAEQKSRAADSVELAAWLARRSLFPAHPYGFPPLGVAGTVGKLDEGAVQRWHAATIQRQLPIVVIVGGTQGSTLVTRDITEGFVRRETDASLKARVAQPADAPLARESASGTRDIAAFALATPGGRDADDRWAALAACLARRLEAEDFRFTARFAPALQRGELLVIGEGQPDSLPRLIEAIERALSELSKRPPSADEWRLAAQQAATEIARATDAALGRSRAYATAVYLGRAPSEVDVAPMSIRQAAALSSDILETLSGAAAGRGLVRGARLAQPKAAP
ncbi:MAG: hypothetical protein CFK52_01375 [Chloracidobacterium sp. CP2_5A]|nr:MAG: hypothetical protein CFK52_01375 [Chloracidobacterium sp. CP2_5A]